MSDEILDEITATDYKYGFTTDIESDTMPPGLNARRMLPLGQQLDFQGTICVRHWCNPFSSH